VDLYEGPDDCPACGRRYRPGATLIGFRPCLCAGRDDERGHVTALCRLCGWETWPGCKVADGTMADLFPALRVSI
jgi:hypothetical protein